MTKPGPGKKLCMMTTVPWSLTMLCRGQIPYFISRGWKVTCISGEGDNYHHQLSDQGARAVKMPLLRQPAPLRDLWALIRLWWFFLFNRFDVIHVSTPKAMLLGTLAAFLAGQPNRVITMRGRAYENFTGTKRKIFARIDQLCYMLARRIIPICRELGELIVAEGCKESKIRFLGASSNGIDTSEKFKLTCELITAGKDKRRQMGIDENDVVILFVGRLRKAKGVDELVSAFKLLDAPQGARIHLILVGPPETDADPLADETEAEIANNPCIHTTGQQDNPSVYFAMADMLAFPTYREGFGNVALEASAMELPVVASNIMGPRESIVDGQTGILVEVQTIQPLAAALQKLIDDPELRRQMGAAGRKRAVEQFNPEKIWQGILSVYDELIS